MASVRMIGPEDALPASVEGVFPARDINDRAPDLMTRFGARFFFGWGSSQAISTSMLTALPPPRQRLQTPFLPPVRVS